MGALVLRGAAVPIVMDFFPSRDCTHVSEWRNDRSVLALPSGVVKTSTAISAKVSLFFIIFYPWRVKVILPLPARPRHDQ